jgi:RimJ/RimL family protein N-acetyltransferase
MADFRHETERLILRDWREEDWAPFWEGTNTPNVMAHLGGVLDEDARQSTRARLELYTQQHGHTFWCVERKSDGAVLGFCGLKRCTSVGGPIGAMEAGWRLAEDAWGQGYAKEAASASLALAFGQFGAEEVIALTVEGNRSSWGLMLRLGMVRREDLDFTEDHWSGQQRPTIVYAIARDTWLARHG